MENGHPKLARRMDMIEPFHVMDLLARARRMESEGRDIVHMEIGEPDFISPAPVLEAGAQALAQGLTHYTPALGLAQLRAAIARYYRDRYDVRVDPARVVVTPGASGALQLATLAILDPGDEVLLADPGYPCNRHFVYLAGGVPVSVPVGADTKYQLTAELVERYITPRTTAVLLASPSNPTGSMVAIEELAAIADIARRQNACLVVDEIYHGLVYGERPRTAAEFEDVYVINSFSKYFGMTGWRLGWMVAPASHVRAIDRLAQNVFLAPSTPAQHAALQAFAPATLDIIEDRRVEFMRRRDFLLPALRDLGFVIPVEPQGAFYLYADCSHFCDDSYAFTLDLLEQAGVAITPGRDFGRYRADEHVRFAYTTTLDRLQEGVDRLRRYLSGKAAG